MLRVLVLLVCALVSTQCAQGRHAATPVIVRPSDGEIIARSDVNMTVEVSIANWSPNELVVLLSVNDAPMAPERVAERFNTFSLEPLPEGHHVVTAKLLAVQGTLGGALCAAALAKRGATCRYNTNGYCG